MSVTTAADAIFVDATVYPALDAMTPAEAAAYTRPEARVIAEYETPHGPHPVRITLFQLGDVIGVGVYPTERAGTVLRWDHGIDEDPAVIHRHAPHCGDDECGSPCGHEEAGR